MARNFDAVARLHEWCASALRLWARFPRLSARLTIPLRIAADNSQPVGTMVDWIRIDIFADRLSEAKKEMGELLKVGAQLRNTLDIQFGDEGLEFSRDVDLMMGAGVVKYMQDVGIKPTATDLSDIAIAVGLERDDPEGRASDSRWRKRLPLLRSASGGIDLSLEGELPKALDPDFFEPF